MHVCAHDITMLVQCLLSMTQMIANMIPTRLSPLLREPQLRHLICEGLVDRVLVPALFQQRGQLLPQPLVLIIQICSTQSTVNMPADITTVLLQTG
jgi:hypothetical protein